MVDIRNGRSRMVLMAVLVVAMLIVTVRYADRER